MPIQQMLLGAGGASAVEYAASNNQTNIGLSSVFGSDWSADVAKIYTVASGINVGGTGGTAAITANSGMGGTLEIVVGGTVTGTGGSAGAGGGGDNLNNYVNPHVNTFHWNDSYQGQNGSNGGNGWNYNRNQYSSAYYVGTGGGGGSGGSAGNAVTLASGISYTKTGSGTFNGSS